MCHTVNSKAIDSWPRKKSPEIYKVKTNDWMTFALWWTHLKHNVLMSVETMKTGRWDNGMQALIIICILGLKVLGSGRYSTKLVWCKGSTRDSKSLSQSSNLCVSLFFIFLNSAYQHKLSHILILAGIHTRYPSLTASLAQPNKRV